MFTNDSNYLDQHFLIDNDIIEKYLSYPKFSKEDTVLIGDQILTDVYAANSAGIRAILCKPLTELDPLWTRVNRFLSKKKMKQLYQEPYKKLWREIP